MIVGIHSDPQVSETTQLLLAWASGDQQALEALTPRVYRELRRTAANFMKSESQGSDLQATELVHEVYLRLINVQSVQWMGRTHFFAICAQIMRRILVDAARKRMSSKHGGGLVQIEVDGSFGVTRESDMQLVALNDALDELKRSDSRKAKVVELRYFGGLSVEETAAILEVSVETVARDWRLARGWLLSQIAE
jgi:RNA polymerase sigma factor (TIGR02999 family)